MNGWRTTALLAMLSAAPFVPAAEAASREPAGRCHAFFVMAGDSSSHRERRPAFSASEVGDLLFEVWVPEKQASTPLRIKLYNPKGHLYQILDARGNGSSTARSSRRRMRALSALLPVAGTHITTFALYGEWRAEAYFDGAETPCTGPLELVLEP